ncbi:hypothetical protein PBI_MA5_52 [Mycobacterium phage MA5]|uniref:Uncharacterized protein n=1 Tax=Mycobacterium phage MA5 TaxID=2725640 RepID=A0A6M3TBG5_9CAUD|nr:hypothetical protein KIP28_gp39 [Mycobacterium phage MA5]QJD52104.1 hypothetical protein PBI_MA5_52 [Mycobacterium phage MA5]
MSSHSIFDSTFNGMGGSENYRALLAPDSFPDVKPPLVDNWPAEDREMYCGGEYTPGYLRLVKDAA